LRGQYSGEQTSRTVKITAGGLYRPKKAEGNRKQSCVTSTHSLECFPLCFTSQVFGLPGVFVVCVVKEDQIEK